jgi:hypothetical protein
VHHRLRLIVFPTRTISDLTANSELSRFPHKERIHMPAPTTTQSWVRTRDVARIHVAFRQVQRRRRSGLKPPFAALLVGLCTPRPTLRPRSRDRQRTAWGRYGSLDLVSSETFTPYSLPVSPAHLDMWLRHSAPSVRPSFLFYSVVVVIAVGTVEPQFHSIHSTSSFDVREKRDQRACLKYTDLF